MFRFAALCLLSVTALCRAAPAERLQLTVRLQVYAGAETVVQRAQQDAADIFRAVGIELRWLSDMDDVKLSDINLVILPERMARNLRTNSHPFGLAVPGGRAYIFMDRLKAFANNEMVNVRRLLGPVMAHEIGHLLLGPDSHHTMGIMHERWRAAELKHALMGSLTFTPQQGQTMRTHVRTRAQCETAVD
jgi:hypothetical protein